MPELNPYESPQLIERKINARRTDELDPDYFLSPEWKSVCRGAGNCYLAVVVIFDSILFAIIIAVFTGAYQVGQEIATIIGTYLFYAAVIFGWVAHWIGLFKLQRITYPRAASRYFTQSLIAFFLLHALFVLGVVWISIGSMQNKNGDIHELLIGTGLAMFGLLTAHTLTLLSGVQKIGELISDNNMSKKAATAFKAMVAVTAIEALLLLVYFLELFQVINVIGKQLFRDFSVIGMLTIIIGIGIAVAYYASAMKQLSECEKLFEQKDP